MFFNAYAFKGQVHVHVFAGRVKIVKSLVLQDKCNFEIFLSPEQKSMKNYPVLSRQKVNFGSYNILQVTRAF